VNGPFRRDGESVPTRVVFAVPRIAILWFAGALILNATTMLLLAAALVTHLLGGRH
jgi:hypothetical protein